MEKTLIKRYDYFHTGMNIDVLNFNINYNYQYVYGLDTMVGLFNKYSEAFNTIINQQVNANEDLQKAVKDGKDANAEFKLNDNSILLTANEDFHIKQMSAVLQEAITKRKNGYPNIKTWQNRGSK